jgi:ribosomal-protein-alanine N-acetyltransferase
MIVLETRRLILRRLGEDDVEPLAAIHADPDVMRFIGGVRTRAQTQARLCDLIENQRRLGFSKWAVVLRSTGELIGRCGPIVERIDGVSEVEVGYDIARSHWGRGLATEAARAAVEHCLSSLGLARVIALIHPQNVASQAVARRIGMTYERDVEWRGGVFGLHAREARAATIFT